MTLHFAKSKAQAFVSIRARNEGGYSIDISDNAHTGGYCRLVRELWEAIDILSAECGEPSNETISKIMLHNYRGGDWKSWNPENPYLARKLATIARLESNGAKAFKTVSDCVYLRGTRGEVYCVTPTGEAHYLNPEPCAPTEPYGC